MSDERKFLYDHIWSCKAKMEETARKSFKVKELCMKKFFADEAEFWKRRMNSYIKELDDLDVA